MKVLYDIAVLGHGYRTGVSRVVEELARRLVQGGECELRMCATGTVMWLALARQYAEQSETLGDTPLLPRLPVREALLRLRHRLCRNPQAPLAVRVMRRSLELLDRESLDRAFLEQADIFHSNFYAIPGRAKQVKNLRRFLTVYDLSQIRVPQFCHHMPDGFLAGVIGSIGPEEWTVCISESTRQQLLEYRPDLDPARVRVAHLAADGKFRECKDTAAISEAKRKAGVPAEGRYFLSLCTLEPRKNLEHTVRCFQRLVRAEAVPDLYLVLAGGKGWQYEPLLRVIEADGQTRDRIVLPGFVPDEDLSALYSGSLGFLYVSLYEGFGLPPLEAMQCGAAVITSNTTSLPEVVGDAGIMVDPTDADALCEAMLALYCDDGQRRCLGAKSLARARQFSWEKCAREVVGAYRAAMQA